MVNCKCLRMVGNHNNFNKVVELQLNSENV
jgi:hypothetical protein